MIRQTNFPEDVGIPREWISALIKDVANINMVQSPSSDFYNSKGFGLPFLQGKSEFGDIYPKPNKWCSDPIKLANEGNILISVRAPVGDVNIASCKCCIGRGLASLSIKNSADNMYMFYLLKYLKSSIEEMGSGTTFKSINRGVLENLIVLLPPLPEQQRIAYVLSAVQGARDKTQSVVEAAREMKKSLMKHLFTYGPVSLSDVGKISLNDTDIGKIPDNWKVMQIGDICQLKTGTTPSTENPRYYEGNVPFIKTSEIVNKKIEKALTHVTEKAIEDYNLKIFPPGTVFLAMYGQGKTRGQVGILKIPAATTQNTAAINPNDGLSSEFLWQWLMSQYNNLRSDGSQGHISHLNLGYVKHYKIPIPPLNEQLNIIKILGAIDSKINEEENKKKALDALFQTFLHYLMTGKIRVNHLEMVQ
jgi:type I restriction enzyme S subunit